MTWREEPTTTIVMPGKRSRSEWQMKHFQYWEPTSASSSCTNDKIHHRRHRWLLQFVHSFRFPSRITASLPFTPPQNYSKCFQAKTRLAVEYPLKRAQCYIVRQLSSSFLFLHYNAYKLATSLVSLLETLPNRVWLPTQWYVRISVESSASNMIFYFNWIFQPVSSNECQNYSSLDRLSNLWRLRTSAKRPRHDLDESTSVSFSLLTEWVCWNLEVSS